MSEEILRVKDLIKFFKTTQGVVRAVDRVSFSIQKGETFGLVGESGSGKSTTAFTIMGVYPPTGGEIFFKGVKLTGGVKSRPLSLKKDMQMVFQDPGSSLNPRHSIGQIIELPLKVHKLYENNRKERVEEILKMVGLPLDFTRRYPRQLGGGEKQLVAISRAIASEPSFIALDEPTSALDVSMQAKIINTLLRIQKELDLSYLFITHNLSLMRNVATRVGIMYLGKLLEVAPTSEFFIKPLHPYTKMLISSIPVITKEEEKLKPERIISRGEIPSPVNVPPGCAFHPRCVECQEMCSKTEPEMIEVEENHYVRCNLYIDQSK
ncbi:ABC transporter ATP-binding protein [Candidatus Bathyarchaeota archaeon]|nr:ABC transporter ATP-binding protein [Candidatus Bathyarchaeota archaeon]